MTHIVNALVWQEQSVADQPLAAFVLDFGIDLTWQFSNLYGSFQQRPIFPNGINIDNSNGQTVITVTAGPLVTDVQPFTNQNIQLPQNTSQVTIACAAAVQVPASFYIVPPSGTGVNYAGATQNTMPEAQCFATVAAGIVTIQKATGIASIVRTGPGFFVVTMAPTMPDLNYTILSLVRSAVGGPAQFIMEDDTFIRTVATFGLQTGQIGVGNIDPLGISLKIFG